MTADSAAAREEALFGTRVKPEALKALRRRNSATIAELRSDTGFAKSTINDAMKLLVTAGVVEAAPYGKKTKAYRYTLTPAGEHLSVAIDVLETTSSVRSLPSLSVDMSAGSLASVAAYLTARRPFALQTEVTEDELTQPISSVVWSDRPALD